MTDYSAQAHFGDYWPPDFGWGGAADPEAHANQLVAFHFDGVNFGQCHKDALPVFTAILTELVPHIPGGLKAGSCWSYSTTDNLPDGTRSFHSFGIAMDVNWNANPMGNNIPDGTGQYAIPRAQATSIARKYGCEWGGNWGGGFHDLMHFELHIPPAVARTVTVQEATPVTHPHPSPSPAPTSDLPTTGVWAERWTNPATGTNRRAAAWLMVIVGQLASIAADVKAIRAHLEKGQ